MQVSICEAGRGVVGQGQGLPLSWLNVSAVFSPFPWRPAAAGRHSAAAVVACCFLPGTPHQSAATVVIRLSLSGVSARLSAVQAHPWGHK